MWEQGTGKGYGEEPVEMQTVLNGAVTEGEGLARGDISPACHSLCGH